ncbi:MAG: ABC transporter ATP-binding protein, partial [Oscillospiraceae bacterium]|nr:ABC transporter ATP-binding protein [Oscillospiraceae bacterium]
MLKTFQKFFDFADAVNKKRFYQSMWLGVLRSFFQALKIPALYLVLQAILTDTLSWLTILGAAIMMLVSVSGATIVYQASSMKQTIAGYQTSAGKRIEIAEHLRYLPMGYFNRKTLGD